MAHDASKVLLGSVPNSCKDVSREDADPASFPAGTAVRRSSTGGLVIADNSTAILIGVSCGKDLADTKKTAVARTGLKIPLTLTNQNAVLVEKDLTFTAVAAGVGGDEITIEFLDTGTAGAEAVTVTDTLISVSMEDGVSTATQMKAALDGEPDALALITTAIAPGQGAVAQDAFAEEALADGGAPYVTLGGVVYVDSVTGFGVDSSDGQAVATGAIYACAAQLTGVKEDGTTSVVALVDMLGGL